MFYCAFNAYDWKRIRVLVLCNLNRMPLHSRISHHCQMWLPRPSGYTCKKCSLLGSLFISSLEWIFLVQYLLCVPLHKKNSFITTVVYPVYSYRNWSTLLSITVFSSRKEQQELIAPPTNEVLWFNTMD